MAETLGRSWLGNYGVYRAERDDGRVGGGALLLANDKHPQTAALGVVTPNVQVAACVMSTGGIKLGVACVYRSPATTTTEDRELLEFISRFSQEERILILGDFNAPEAEWEAWNAPIGSFGDALLCTLQDRALVQHVSEPTRHRIGQHANTLDLVITKHRTEITGVAYRHLWE